MTTGPEGGPVPAQPQTAGPQTAGPQTAGPQTGRPYGGSMIAGQPGLAAERTRLAWRRTALAGTASPC